jgi:hypothetical protein
MKKLLLLAVVLFGFAANAQSDYLPALPSDNSTSGNARAPHGKFRYQRGIYLIKATEMTASGLVNTNIINSIAFNYLAAQDVTTAGTMTIYLQNTADVTNLKSATWATAITGMTTVSTGAVTIPNTTGFAYFNFTGGSVFTYTGGGVYVAFDYQNATNALPTAFVTVDCNSTGLVSGFKGAQSDTAIPTATTASSFRPATLLGKYVACGRPTNLSATSTYTTTSAQLSWSVTAGGTTDFEYGPYNYTQGLGTTTAATTSPFTQTGLTASTPYEYYVRKNCGVPGYSAWEGPYPFHTTYLPATPSYNTGFNYDDLPMIGWKNEPSTDGFGSDWYAQYGTIANGFVQEGVASAFSVVGVTTAALNTRMYARGVNLTAGSNVTITWYDRNYQGGTTVSTNTADYNVTVGSEQTTWTQTTNIASITGLSTSTWTLRTYTYTPPTTGTYYFSFQNVSPANATGVHALAIDNFTVSEVLATDSFVNNKFSVSPNPTTGLINVTNNDGITVNEITVTDLNGRVVKTTKFDNVANISINIADLSAGMYLMSIKSDAGIATKKIVKE